MDKAEVDMEGDVVCGAYAQRFPLAWKRDVRALGLCLTLRHPLPVYSPPRFCAFDADTFFVSAAGMKLSGGDAESVVRVLTSMLHAHDSMKAAASSEAARRPVQSDAPAAAAAAAKGNAGLVYSLMDSYLPNDVLSVQRDVLRHVRLPTHRPGIPPAAFR